MKTFAILGSLSGMLAVVTGAFGAHALADKVDARMLEIWQTAAHYQIVHALALFAAAWLVSQTQSTAAITAGWCFTAGILVFSGSLYLMVFTGARWLGAITPIGGTAMIVGWFCCMLAALKLGS